MCRLSSQAQGEIELQSSCCLFRRSIWCLEIPLSFSSIIQSAWQDCSSDISHASTSPNFSTLTLHSSKPIATAICYISSFRRNTETTALYILVEDDTNAISMSLRPRPVDMSYLEFNKALVVNRLREILFLSRLGSCHGLFTIFSFPETTETRSDNLRRWQQNPNRAFNQFSHNGRSQVMNNVWGSVSYIKKYASKQAKHSSTSHPTEIDLHSDVFQLSCHNAICLDDAYNMDGDMEDEGDLEDVQQDIGDHAKANEQLESCDRDGLHPPIHFMYERSTLGIQTSLPMVEKGIQTTYLVLRSPDNHTSKVCTVFSSVLNL